MSNLFIFAAGLITTALCALFVVFSVLEMRRLTREGERRTFERND